MQSIFASTRGRVALEVFTFEDEAGNWTVEEWFKGPQVQIRTSESACFEWDFSHKSVSLSGAQMLEKSLFSGCLVQGSPLLGRQLQHRESGLSLCVSHVRMHWYLGYYFTLELASCEASTCNAPLDKGGFPEGAPTSLVWANRSSVSALLRQHLVKNHRDWQLLNP